VLLLGLALRLERVALGLQGAGARAVLLHTCYQLCLALLPLRLLQTDEKRSEGRTENT
jgi:hypothetical protein